MHAMYTVFATISTAIVWHYYYNHILAVLPLLTYAYMCICICIQISEVLGDCFVEFCECLKLTPTGHERDQAYMGLLAAVQACPPLVLGRDEVRFKPTFSIFIFMLPLICYVFYICCICCIFYWCIYRICVGGMRVYTCLPTMLSLMGWAARRALALPTVCSTK